MTETYIEPTDDQRRSGAPDDPACCGPGQPGAGRGLAGPRHGGGRCCQAPSSQVRSFLQARLLLLVLERPAHGYDLMERLAAEGDAPVDPGLLYRTLRLLEEEGLVRSAWETDGGGPARRLYETTAEGVEYLHSWAVSIRDLERRLDRFLAAYEDKFQNQRRT